MRFAVKLDSIRKLMPHRWRHFANVGGTRIQMAIEVARRRQEPIGELLFQPQRVGADELLEAILEMIGRVEGRIYRRQEVNVVASSIQIVKLRPKIIFDMHSPDFVIDAELHDMGPFMNFLRSGENSPTQREALIDRAPLERRFLAVGVLKFVAHGKLRPIGQG